MNSKPTYDGKSLENKVAIVTGAASGIGEATARAFVDLGCRVLIADLQKDKGEALARQLGDSALFSELDVADEQQWHQAAAKAVEKFGGVDILVNCAGRLHFGSILETSSADFEAIQQTNLLGTFLGIKVVAPLLLERRGSIVNVSSIEGMRGLSEMGAYVASKWGVRGLTKVAALELGRHGVRVNSVHPGTVNTPMANPKGLPVEALNETMAHVPLHRTGEPGEIAQAILFLASDAASFVNGSELVVDGGQCAGVYIRHFEG